MMWDLVHYVVVGLGIGFYLLGPHAEAAGAAVADLIHGKGTEPSPIEELHQRYLDGEIGEQELEDQLAVLVDDRATTIRDLCDDVDGIGEQLSRALASEFDDVAALKGATAEDFQEIDGVGETKAQRLEQRLTDYGGDSR